VCEDHDVIVEGVKLMLAHQEQFVISGQARNQQELSTLFEKAKPDALLLDLNLNGQDGFTILEQLRNRDSTLKVVIFTMYQEAYLIEKARKHKANGYLLKNSSKEELLEALNFVFTSNEFFLGETLLKAKRENKVQRDEFIEKMHLTVREIEIIKLVSEGKSAQEIADQLFLSLHTVDTHRRNILGKLKLKNIADLVRFAAKNHLI
jgi:DNA-binding NarL/FixJ family response regulator